MAQARSQAPGASGKASGLREVAHSSFARCKALGIRAARRACRDAAQAGIAQAVTHSSFARCKALGQGARPGQQTVTLTRIMMVPPGFSVSLFLG